MLLTTRIIGLDAGGKKIVVLNESDARELGVRSLDRVHLVYREYELTAIVNTTSKLIRAGELGAYHEVEEQMHLSENISIEVAPAPSPHSLIHIRTKLRQQNLTRTELKEIVEDVVEGRLSEAEIAAFVVGLHCYGLSDDETFGLSTAMVETGKRLHIEGAQIADKHSIGGVPGDKTTLLVVPIVASCGVTIPKTSSRAITSAAGTADRAEIFMPVEFSADEMERIVNRTKSCIVWGGSLDLAPADDMFIQVENSLSIDPLLLPSILSKKKAVNANIVVIDIPCGRGAKVATIAEARTLARNFMTLGTRFGMRLSCAITAGDQPVGHCIGPALEAREALETIMRLKTVPDLVDKVVDIAGMILRMAGLCSDGRAMAMESIRSGRAEKKLRDIIAEQGGKRDITPEDIVVGQHQVNIESSRTGYVFWINNTALVRLARISGSPRDKGAGVVIHKKIGDQVNAGDSLFTIFAERETKLSEAEEFARNAQLFGVSHRMEMTIEEISEFPEMERAFILER